MGADADDLTDEDRAAAGRGPRTPPAGRRSRWAVISGVVALAYAVWAAVDVLVLARQGSTFTELHRRYGNIAVRLLACTVLVALLHHGLDGLRTTVEDLVPSTRRADRGLRAAVRFAVPALAIPGALVLLWPWIRAALA